MSRADLQPVLSTWLAFMAGLWLGGEIVNVESLLIAAATGAVLVYAGFAAVSRTRPPIEIHGQRVRFAAFAVAAGVALGLANLGANASIAALHPAIHAALSQRLTTLGPVSGIISAPLVEEVAMRLFLLSVLVWVVSRVVATPTLAFNLALLASSLAFALLHLDRPMPADAALASLYRGTLAVKYTLAALPLGWVFWRWGLPYAMVCHAAANAVHLVAQRPFF